MEKFRAAVALGSGAARDKSEKFNKQGSIPLTKVASWIN